MKIGYARVSTSDQDLSSQVSALRREGCSRIYQEHASGKNVERVEWQACSAHLREGDCLVVWKVDRLGRSLMDLLNIIEDLAKRGIAFHSITDKIDTKTTTGRFTFKMLASLAELERELNSERTRAGLAEANAKGRFGGRKRKLTPKQLRAAQTLLDANTPSVEVAATFGVHKSTLYRSLSRAQSEDP